MIFLEPILYFVGYAIRNEKYYLFFILKNPQKLREFFGGGMGIYLSWLILYPSEQCGASLQESSLNKVVQMLKTAIVTELRHWMETNENVYNVKILLTMMKEVYKVRVHPKECIYHFTKSKSLRCQPVGVLFCYVFHNRKNILFSP